MQSLLVLQSLRASLGFGTEPSPTVIEEFVTNVAASGFDGLALVSDSPVLPNREIAMLRERGMVWEAQCYPRTVDDLKPVLEFAAAGGAHHVNLQPDVRPSSLGECIRLLEAWQGLADEAGIDLMVETHRNRMTNDLLFTLDLLAALPGLKLTGDIAHYVVAREMWLPISDENDDRMKQILDRCWNFHGRVSSAEQIQIPWHFPQSGPWIDQYSRWWSHGFAAWRQQAAPDASLTFLCELVPPPYALTDVAGNEFSDRWRESLMMKDLVQSLWESTSGDLGTPHRSPSRQRIASPPG